MSTTHSYYYPAFVGNINPHRLLDGTIENVDGSKMYAANFETFDLEEEPMTTSEKPHIKVPLTFKAAMWLGIGFVGTALAGAWAMYTHLDNKLETYRTGTETKIESSRTSLDNKIESSKITLDSKIDSLRTATDAHFEAARSEAKADNATIMTQLTEVSKSIAELNGKLSKDNN